MTSLARPNPSRRMFNGAFTTGLVGFVSLLTGVSGYRLRQHFSFDAMPWRPGTWTDQIIWGQVGFGMACLVISAFLIYRINQRLSRQRL